ncbi:hypothetical protein F511_20853 [Dorcoceras hygrometricum]|uniref:CCT domain-containing protein n=1 Tax=Dorcoceras hygrometricum TaxID=472368 RepID=A0A2Z7CCY8_9LAMI|nr:hypothetical protein F511_20853 [Dorcoceras hygrometricum]
MNNNYNTTFKDKEIEAAAATITPPSTPTAPGNQHLSVIFDTSDDQIENDISASIDFTLSPSFPIPNHHPHMINSCNQEPFANSSINNPFLLDMADGQLHQYMPDRRQPVVPMLGPPLPVAAGYENECGLNSVPPYIRLRPPLPGCGIMDPVIGQYLNPGSTNAPFSAENSGIFTGGALSMGPDFSNQELEFQSENGGLFMPDSMARGFNCTNELQVLSSESQHLVHGGTCTTNPLASDLDDPTFKVGKLSVEERKRKIHRYMKKRNERNFSKKIKYACRKTLADSRPRVRGRFAKNDELGEMNGRSGCSNHEDDTDEDVSLFSNKIPHHHQRKVVVKEEDDIDDSDIFAHISGVNSFKCNYQIQSWI